MDVTGGMDLRLRTAWELTRYGIESLILDGNVPGRLEAALSRRSGAGRTRIARTGKGRNEPRGVAAARPGENRQIPGGGGKGAAR